MTKRTFTEEEKALLRINPYTLSVQDNQIKFTLEFKKFVLEEIDKPGMTFPKILNKANYDIKLLGRPRADAILRSIRREATSSKGLRETGRSKEVLIKENLTKMRTQKSISILEERVSCLEQELDLIKKLSLLRQPQE